MSIKAGVPSSDLATLGAVRQGEDRAATMMRGQWVPDSLLRFAPIGFRDDEGEEIYGSKVA